MLQASAETVRSRAAGARYQPLVIVLVAVCAGIVTDRVFPLAVGIWWDAALITTLAWFCLWRCRWDRVAGMVLMLAVAATAASWHHCRWQLFAIEDLGHFATDADEPVCIEAMALERPRPMARPVPSPLRAVPAGEMVRLDVAPLLVRDGVRWRPVSGRARLTVLTDLADVQGGDRLQVFARLAKPPPAHNPGEFDYADYLRGDRTQSELSTRFSECISVIANGRSWNLARVLQRLRAHSSRILAQHLDPRRAALAAAVLLGERELLDPEVTETFLETGSIHLLVIAGLHVGILAAAMLYVLRRLPIPRGAGLAVVAAFVTLYALMVDAQPPVVRATILVLVSCWSLYLGRPALGFNTLAAAALIVLVLNPVDLFRTGAQLSFLCVAGLVGFAPYLRDRRKPESHLARLIAENEGWLPRAARYVARRLWALAMVGAVIWLTSMPLVMARFHLFTPVALLINVAVWMPVALALVSGWATVLLGTLAWPLGHVGGAVSNGIFWVLERLVTAARNTPGSHFWVPGPADWWLAGFYGMLAVFFAFPRLRPPRRWCLALVTAWSSLGFGVSLFHSSPGRLDCTFLSMNHGCAVVLELPSGQTMLYDAGRMGSPLAATRSISAMLWSRGLTHIDGVVLSHGDVDHYNGLPGLLERFSVGAIYVSPVMFEGDNAAMRALKQAIAASGVPVRQVHAGDELRGGPGCRIEVLHPLRHGVLGSTNANSLVLAVEYGGHRILLTGDLESPGLNDLLAERPTNCDILMAPHHGSQQSNAPGLAAWCTPQWVVMSSSRQWDTRPVRAAYQVVGSQVMETIDSGAIRATLAPNGVRMEGFLPR